MNGNTGRHLTEEQRNKIRLARLGTHLSAETRAKISSSNIGKHSSLVGYRHTEEARRNMSLSHMGNKNNLGLKASDTTRAKMSLAHAGSNNSFFGKCHTEEVKRIISLSRKGKPTTLGHRASEETKLKMSTSRKGKSVNKSATRSQTYKQLWQNPEWSEKQVKRILESQHMSPNKPESILLNLLNTHFPNEWKYVGDGSFIIGRLNPDFVNINGKKQVIEFFGDYWHKPEEEQKRQDIFSTYGFSTLVIWENELNNLDKVLTRLNEFSDSQYEASQSRASKNSNILGKCRDFIRSIPVNRDSEKVQS